MGKQQPGVTLLTSRENSVDPSKDTRAWACVYIEEGENTHGKRINQIPIPFDVPAATSFP